MDKARAMGGSQGPATEDELVDAGIQIRGQLQALALQHQIAALTEVAILEGDAPSDELIARHAEAIHIALVGEHQARRA